MDLPPRKRRLATADVEHPIADSGDADGPTQWTLSNGLVVNRCPTNSTADYVHYMVNVRSLADLIALAGFKEARSPGSNIQFAMLRRLAPPLEALQSLVGMDDVKRMVFEMCMFQTQKLERHDDFLHAVVSGKPGVGKTRLIGILADVYAALGVLRRGHIVWAKRTDLIGQFLGQTAAKTQEVIDRARDGILVIDEAYSLGNEEGRDIYSKECLDTLNAALSESRANFVCIIAGYAEQIQKCFFAVNPGLERRFPYRFAIADYGPAELSAIFQQLAVVGGWRTASPGVGDVAFFREHAVYFQFGGGDVETVLAQTKVQHAVRVFSLHRRDKKVITAADLDKGLEAFLRSKNVRDRKESGSSMMNMMYI